MGGNGLCSDHTFSFVFVIFAPVEEVQMHTGRITRKQGKLSQKKLLKDSHPSTVEIMLLLAWKNTLKNIPFRGCFQQCWKVKISEIMMEYGSDKKSGYAFLNFENHDSGEVYYSEILYCEQSYLWRKGSFVKARAMSFFMHPKRWKWFWWWSWKWFCWQWQLDCGKHLWL